MASANGPPGSHAGMAPTAIATVLLASGGCVSITMIWAWAWASIPPRPPIPAWAWASSRAPCATKLTSQIQHQPGLPGFEVGLQAEWGWACDFKAQASTPYGLEARQASIGGIPEGRGWCSHRALVHTHHGCSQNHTRRHTHPSQNPGPGPCQVKSHTRQVRLKSQGTCV